MHTTLRLLAAALVALPVLAAAPSRAAAQAKFFACYVPSSGSTYRIKTPDTPSACMKSNHVEFSWTDGAGALRVKTDTIVNHTGALLNLRNSGSGNGAIFAGGAGKGVYGTSNSSAGVHGYVPAAGSSAGVRAESGVQNGTALEITRGAIRVAGAGADTPTAAFRIDASAAMGGTFHATIDNPHTNGDKNAILLVTRNTGPNGIHPAYEGSHVVFYDTGMAKWRIRYSTKGGSLTDGYLPFEFNVLVIKP